MVNTVFVGQSVTILDHAAQTHAQLSTAWHRVASLNLS